MADFTLSIGKSGTIQVRPSSPVGAGTMVFTVKKNTGSPVTIQTQRVKVQPSGIIHITLYDADTAPLTPGTWVCDLQLIRDTGQNYVIAVGSFNAVIPVRQVGE